MKGKGKTMTGDKYQELASRTMNPKLLKFQTELHAVHGLAGEVGEIHSIYQKVYQGHDLDTEHLKKEIGDLLWFVAELCTVHDWKLEDIMKLNIKKLHERYPEGFDSEHSLHRKSDDI